MATVFAENAPQGSHEPAVAVSARPDWADAGLFLADGSVFWGKGAGAPRTVVGELCFNTSMTGYQEILTDPSYAGQIINFTFPHIGNVGTNPEDIETFVKEGIAPREKLRFLGNGIDVRRFDPARIPAETTSRLRAEFGIAPGDKVIGFIGRLVVEKGILELVAATAQIAREVPGVKLLVIGPSGGEKSDAMSKDDPRFDPVRDVAIFTGLRDDIPEMLSLMDVFVLPSHREGFPRSPMEAAAMKKPAIVTDITGCRETVRDGENGYLFPKGDAAALAAKIQDLLLSPERARAFGEAGRRLAEERFDERKVFRIVADTYRELLEQKGLEAPIGMS